MSLGYYGPLVFGSKLELTIGAMTTQILNVSDGVSVAQPCLILRSSTPEAFLASAAERGRPITNALRRMMQGAHFYEVATD